VTADARRDYAGGEQVAYRLRSLVGCHVAVFCHQVDGSTVVLFPNAWNQDTWVPADKTVEIPGTAKHGFEIVVGPPYGADVMQVVACTTRSALHRLVQEISARKGTLTRGMFVKGIADGLTDTGAAPDAAPPRWSEAHLVVCTYPRGVN
jgi:hypothetical protein